MGAFLLREGSLKVGDRLLSVDGIPLHGASHATALAMLRQCSHEALFQVEYDVATPGQQGTCGWEFPGTLVQKLSLDNLEERSKGGYCGHWRPVLGSGPEKES